MAWRDPTASSPALLRLTRSDGGAVADTTTPAGTTEHQFTGLHRTREYCVRIALVYSTNLTVAAAPACTQPPGSTSAATAAATSPAAVTPAAYRPSGTPRRRHPTRCAPWPVLRRRHRRGQHPTASDSAATTDGPTAAQPGPRTPDVRGRRRPITAPGARAAICCCPSGRCAATDASAVLHPPDRAAVWRDLLP
ncbi:hypothetical protein GCM10020218_068160 [Dactylosporangium vinaceum]